MTAHDLGGILLTGGSSSRMGTDKASIEIAGAPMGQRIADLLALAVDLAVEVGPGVTSLPSVREHPSGMGPLGAIVAGHEALLAAGLSKDGACVVLACDLPLLSSKLVVILASEPFDRALLPIVDGIPQPLCARWSATDLVAAAEAFSSGKRSLQGLPDPSSAIRYDETTLGALRVELEDADTPEDLARLTALRRAR